MTEIVDLFEGLNEEEAESIVSAGIELMSAITDAYGPGQGTELWNQFGEVLGQEAKHAILIAMLQGGAGRTVTILAMDENQRQRGQKVAAIKAVRAANGMGLKEAKEAIELAWDQGRNVPIKLMKHVSRTDFCANLRNAGIPYR
jgi:hypothetical protein